MRISKIIRVSAFWGTTMVLLWFLGFTKAFGQKKEIAFERINTDNGLSSNTVYCALQDSKGYIWFGTKDGLNRYNGYQFEVFRASDEKENDLSNNQILCLAEGKDGRIYIGTYDGGLNVYDYETNSFRTFKNDPNNSSSIGSNSIYDLIVTKSGELWIGTFGGGLSKLVDYKQGRFTNYISNPEDPKTISNNSVFALHERKDTEVLWIGTFGSGINIFDESGSFKTLKSLRGSTSEKLLKSDDIYDIDGDRDGNIWIATSGAGLAKYDKGVRTITHYRSNPEDKWSLGSDVVRSLAVDNSGRVWVGTEKGGLALYDKERNLFYSYVNNPADPTSLSNNTIRDIMVTKGGTIFVCTEGGGINKFNSDIFQFNGYSSNQNWHTMNANAVMSLMQDSKERVWVGTFQDGLYMLNSKNMEFQSVKEGMVPSLKKIDANTVLALHEDRRGLIWIGTEDQGLYKLDPQTGNIVLYKAGNGNFGNQGGEGAPNDDYGLAGLDDLGGGGGDDYGLGALDDLGLALPEEEPAKTKESSFVNTSSGLMSNTVQVIYEDKKDNIWFGTYDAGLCKYDRANNTFSCYQHTEDYTSISSNQIRSIYEDANGTLWIGTGDGGLNKFLPEKNQFKTYKYDPEDSTTISNNTVTSIIEDPDGKLWIGTFGGGLCQYDRPSNTFIRYTIEDGLVNNEVCAIASTGKHLWISTNKGLSRFDFRSKKFRNYRKNDGLATDEFTPGADFVSKNGNIFFGGNKGFAFFDPDMVEDIDYVPPIYLTAIKKYDEAINFRSLFGKPIAKVDRIELNYDDDFFTVEYVMLEYANPQNVDYYYKMEGFDNKWIYNGSRREASYTNLDAGRTYTFKVKGISADGRETMETAGIDIYIIPAWYDTWQFIWSASIAVFLIAFFIIRNRIKSIERQKVYLEKVVAERTAELRQQKAEVELQKDKSDKLLLNILPLETANELKENGKVAPKHYNMVSVLFTDFKGFTNIAEKLTAEELIDELNQCFMAFDEIVEEHNLEKIKTIGDAYMCAGGIPKANKTNPIDSVLVGIKIQAFMNRVKIEKEAKNEPYWTLRLGVHTGELVAGVIGRKKYAYDIWGDAVNTAARMESSGEPGKINISGATYELVKDFFETEYRGKIQAKNKGEIPMYFVNRIKPELSADKEGFVPNDKFLELMQETVNAW